jgi:hypothetical protein
LDDVFYPCSKSGAPFYAIYHISNKIFIAAQGTNNQMVAAVFLQKYSGKDNRSAKENQIIEKASVFLK